MALHVAVARASRRAVQMMRIAPHQGALELWEAVCGDGAVSDPDLPLLLMPEEYALLDPQAAPEELAELLLVGPCGVSRSLLATAHHAHHAHRARTTAAVQLCCQAKPLTRAGEHGARQRRGRARVWHAAAQWQTRLPDRTHVDPVLWQRAAVHRNGARVFHACRLPRTVRLGTGRSPMYGAGPHASAEGHLL